MYIYMIKNVDNSNNLYKNSNFSNKNKEKNNLLNNNDDNYDDYINNLLNIHKKNQLDESRKNIYNNSSLFDKLNNDKPKLKKDYLGEDFYRNPYNPRKYNPINSPTSILKKSTLNNLNSRPYNKLMNKKNEYNEIKLKEEKNKKSILNQEKQRSLERRLKQLEEDEEKFQEELKKKREEEENHKLVKSLDFYHKKREEEEILEKTDLLFKILFPDYPNYSLYDKLISENENTKNTGSNTDNLLFSEKSMYLDPLFTREKETIEDPAYMNPLYKIKEEDPTIEKELVVIDEEIKNIEDLINLCDKYPLSKFKEYNINMVGIHNVKDSLIELNNLIGLHTLKENIVDQILYFVQDLHKCSEGDYMHTVIYGPPGTGKTEVAKIMGKIYSKLGILKRNVFKKVTRDDLVAGYLGQTSLKTKDVIKECLGGVLFIDEAYALGNHEKKDSFAKESIDTICEALSNHKKDFMCIIAGYEDELKKCFFSFNEGLDSRFTWRFKIDDYNSKELKEIFLKKVKDIGWEVKEEIPEEWFEKNMENFKYFGRDVETLLSKVKIAHSRRVFCKPPEDKKKIILKDLEKGLSMYLSNDNIEERKKEKEFQKQLYNTLYV